MGYQLGETEEDWFEMMRSLFAGYAACLRPGGRLAIVIADTMHYLDPRVPRIQSRNSARDHGGITREEIDQLIVQHPTLSLTEISRRLGCDYKKAKRLLYGHTACGLSGRARPGTRHRAVSGILEQLALDVGLIPEQTRYWIKAEPPYASSPWINTTLKPRADVELVAVFLKPGPGDDLARARERLSEEEWVDWGHSQWWLIPTVRGSSRLHEAEHPVELYRRLVVLFTNAAEPGAMAGTTVVLDACGGSATTVEAVLVAGGRRWLAIERDEAAADVARVRIAALQAGHASGAP